MKNKKLKLSNELVQKNADGFNESNNPESKKLIFPSGFLWGASTAAHQVEGNMKNNWTKWEKENAERLVKEAKTKWQPWQQKKFPEMFEPKNYISGQACDQYHRYEEDFDIVKKLNHNAHRFSIEWSRIEPEEGRFDEKEIKHYRKVIQALRARGIEPFVTLWHWTNPQWIEEMGGPTNKKFIFYFARFAELMAREFFGLVNFWLTINEPTSVISASYISGIWPPQKRNPLIALKVYKILSQAHNQAYETIHSVSQNVQVGFANVLVYLNPVNKSSILDRLTVKIGNYFANRKFLNMTDGYNDFLTLQYYFHFDVAFLATNNNKNEVVSDLGWEVYPEGIYHLLKNLGKYNLPIYITENGLADAEDEKREKFIKDSLLWTHRAINEGIDVRGYFYWSLIDNFEWDKGFWPRFGLVEINYKTQERKIRSSALEYAKICQENTVKI